MAAISAFPRIWFRLTAPSDPSEIGELVTSALASEVPLDVSTSPALWGGYLRATNATLCCTSTTAYEQAVDHTHATDLIQAHLIELLSCIGRAWIDFYFLTLRKPVQPHQLAGVLDALDWARQEGHVRHLGLFADGESLAILSQWQLNNAFEVLLGNAEVLRTLAPLARERRVGVIELGEDAQTDADVLLRPVSSLPIGVP